MSNRVESTPQFMPTPRIASLDSLRGIAALGVVATHVLQYGFPFVILNHTPLRVLVNGRCFVIFFFVLSGFVLSLGLLRSNLAETYLTYLLRRVARIYLPYFVAGMLSIGVAAYVHSAVNYRAVFEYFALFGTSVGTGLNSPSWSLVYEMRISVIMPSMCWAFLKDRRAVLICFVSVAAVEEIGLTLLGIGQFPYSTDTLLGSVIVTARYALCFVVGIWLADSVMRQSLWLNKIRGWVIPCLGIVAIIFMSVLLDQTSTVASGIILVLALRSAALDRVLSWRLLVWLGRISYSLYLTHVLVLVAVMAALQGIISTSAAAVVGGICSLLFAEGFYRIIEAPSISLSRSIKTYKPKLETRAS
jgi:peptidoglycan/LPS O-acetylase OafA/YrhL